VRARDDQHVRRRLRIDVVEGDQVVVLVDDRCRNFCARSSIQNLDLRSDDTGRTAKALVPKSVVQNDGPACSRAAAHIVVRRDQPAAVGLNAHQIEGIPGNQHREVVADSAVGIFHQHVFVTPSGKITEGRLLGLVSLHHAIWNER